MDQKEPLSEMHNIWQQNVNNKGIMDTYSIIRDLNITEHNNKTTVNEQC